MLLTQHKPIARRRLTFADANNIKPRKTDVNFTPAPLIQISGSVLALPGVMRYQAPDTGRTGSAAAALTDNG